LALGITAQGLDHALNLNMTLAGNTSNPNQLGCFDCKTEDSTISKFPGDPTPCQGHAKGCGRVHHLHKEYKLKITINPRGYEGEHESKHKHDAEQDAAWNAYKQMAAKTDTCLCETKTETAKTCNFKLNGCAQFANGAAIVNKQATAKCTATVNGFTGSGVTPTP
jgi:hypothetical protein